MALLKLISILILTALASACAMTAPFDGVQSEQDNVAVGASRTMIAEIYGEPEFSMKAASSNMASFYRFQNAMNDKGVSVLSTAMTFGMNDRLKNAYTEEMIIIFDENDRAICVDKASLGQESRCSDAIRRSIDFWSLSNPKYAHAFLNVTREFWSQDRRVALSRGGISKTEFFKEGYFSEPEDWLQFGRFFDSKPVDEVFVHSADCLVFSDFYLAQSELIGQQRFQMQAVDIYRKSFEAFWRNAGASQNDFSRAESVLKERFDRLSAAISQSRDAAIANRINLCTRRIIDLPEPLDQRREL